MANSRQKGAQAEREVAQILFAELGMKFARDLRQYQKSDLGDLLCEDDAFPFTIEVKRYAKGWICKPAWEVQAFNAAREAEKHPCVVYRYDGQQWRARIWIDAIGEALGKRVVAGAHADFDIQGFCWIAREIMSRKALEKKPGLIQSDQGMLTRCTPASTEMQQLSNVAKEQTL